MERTRRVASASQAVRAPTDRGTYCGSTFSFPTKTRSTRVTVIARNTSKRPVVETFVPTIGVDATSLHMIPPQVACVGTLVRPRVRPRTSSVWASEAYRRHPDTLRVRFGFTVHLVGTHLVVGSAGGQPSSDSRRRAELDGTPHPSCPHTPRADAPNFVEARLVAVGAASGHGARPRVYAGIMVPTCLVVVGSAHGHGAGVSATDTTVAVGVLAT